MSEEFLEIDEQELEKVAGGRCTQRVRCPAKNWYLHHLGDGPMMKLWYGPEEYTQDPMPDPDPGFPNG